MGKLLEGKLPCPFDGCSSSDAYHKFDDGDWCYSCNKGTWYRPRPEDLKSDFVDFRGVPKDIQKKLGFLSYLDSDNNVLFREYPQDNGEKKFREVIPKKFWTTGKLPKLGGKNLWNAGSSKTICIVEGEEDFASFMVMCDLPVVYLTSASLGTDRREVYDYLNPFRKIVLCFESDDAGNKAKQIIGTMFPGKVFEASLTKYKDANDYLTNKAEKEFYWAVVNAKLFTAEFVSNTQADFRRILDGAKNDVFIDTPFATLNSLIKGLPLSTVVLITGQEGLGKTEILRALEYHALKEHQVPISITHHEEPQHTTLRGLACYENGTNFRDHDKEIVTDEVLKELDKFVGTNLYLTEINQDDLTLNSIMDKFRYLVRVCGVKYFFVDPINQFASGDTGSNVTEFLDSLALAMGKFVIDNNVCCVWTAHVNDEGQTRNSRMIGKASSIRIDIERDHMNEDEVVKNTTKLFVSKNRFASKTGACGSLVFNPETFTINENNLPF